MSRAAVSVAAYSAYLAAMGAALLLVPDLLLGVLGLPSTSEIWIRVLGLFSITVGIYYLASAVREQTAFFGATVAGRLFFCAALTLLVVVAGQPPVIAAIGLVDLAGALWTWRALRSPG